MKILILITILFPFRAESKPLRALFLGYRQPLMDVKVDEEGKKNQDNSPQEILYQPPIPHILSAGFAYGGLTAQFSTHLSESIDKAHYESYFLSLYQPTFGVDVSYTEFKRFKVEESKGFDPILSEGEEFRKDMVLSLALMRLFWFPINFGYDLESSFDPAYSKKTGLAFGFVGTSHQFRATTKQGLIPSQWRSDFGDDSAFQSGILTGFDLEASVALTLEFRGFFISGLAGYGVGMHEYKYHTLNNERTGDGQTEELSWFGTAGYSGKVYFIVARFMQDIPHYDLEYMSIAPIKDDFSVDIGFKF